MGEQNNSISSELLEKFSAIAWHAAYVGDPSWGDSFGEKPECDKPRWRRVAAAVYEAVLQQQRDAAAIAEMKANDEAQINSPVTKLAMKGDGTTVVVEEDSETGGCLRAHGAANAAGQRYETKDCKRCERPNEWPVGKAWACVHCGLWGNAAAWASPSQQEYDEAFKVPNLLRNAAFESVSDDFRRRYPSVAAVLEGKGVVL